MTALNRKLARDLSRLRWQVLAIALVLASGVATFTMSLTALDSLRNTRDGYFASYRFGHVFAHLRRAPDSLARRLADIPGVSRVEPRIVFDVNLDVADFPEPVVGRLISLPRSGEPALHALHLRSGRLPDPDRRGEALVSEAFAAAHALKPGDTLRAIINGRMQRLRIVGVALSPEFVYEIREGEVLPDNKRFGVLWMGEDDLAAAFDLAGAFNNVVVSIGPGAVEQEVIQRLDALIEPFGGLGSYGRSDQTSAKFIAGELDQLRAMAVMAPAIFLSVAAFLLNMVLSRLIGTQREQIAILRAFGYSGGEVARHYLGFMLAIVLTGVAIGTAAGAWMGQGLTVMYARFFRFPLLAYDFDLKVPMMAALVSIGAGLVGTLRPLRRVAALPPAEAMRPPAPGVYRPTALERLGLQRWMTAGSRMVVRSLEREPIRAGLTMLGIAMAVGVLVLGQFALDAINYVLDFQFARVQRQHLMVSTSEVVPSRAVSELRAMPGVRRVEPFRAVAGRFIHGHYSERQGLIGLSPDHDLFVPRAEDGSRVVLPDEGLVLSDKLAERLRAGVGDIVRLEVLDGRRPVIEAPVASIVTDFTGTSAYMDIRSLRRLLREGDTVSGAFLAVDPLMQADLYARLKLTPGVASVVVREAAVKSFRETIAENLLRMRTFNVFFACIIAFGVVYNSARITLAERSRELATLRVIGFTRAEVSAILLGELGVLTAIALPVGMVIGYGFAALVVTALETETQRIPLVVEAPTFAFAAGVTLLAVVVSGLVVRRNVDRFDLVSVLKAQE